MSSIIQRLHERNLITPPHHVISGMQYETIMGSIAYGVADTNEKSMSDVDVYGFSIPFKDMVFPHAAGNVVGFGRQIKKFEQYQQHHIYDKQAKKEYDFNVYNIVKYFQLCMDNNPNMIDSLFTPIRCVLYCSQIGNYVRENRKLFLHKGAWFKFKGYAYSQLHKLKNKKILEFINLCKEYDVTTDVTQADLVSQLNEVHSIPYLNKIPFDILHRLLKLLKDCGSQGNITKRKDIIEKYGYDPKFGYHVVRLLNEVEQIMVEHDLSVDRNREQLKSIRRGEWSIEQIEEYFNKKESELEGLYAKSTLQHSPDEKKIKQVLINCLEMHFGDLNKVISKPTKVDDLVRDLQEVIDRYRVIKCVHFLQQILTMVITLLLHIVIVHTKPVLRWTKL